MSKKDEKNSFWSTAIELNVPVLVNGLHSVDTTETPYPKHEHTGLLDSKGNEVSTPLTAVLKARTEVIPKSLNDKDSKLANTMKKNALSLTYRGTPSQPINKIEWETIHKQLEPLCVQHVKLCLVKNKATSGYINRILEPSKSFSGDFNTSSKKQMDAQTKSFCLDMLADAPYECADNEADVIDAFVAAEELIDVSSVAARNAVTSEQKQTIKTKSVSYKRGLVTLRGMINHTYLKTLHQLGNKPAKKYIKSVHIDFLQHQQDTAGEDDNDDDLTFTAKYLIKDIVDRCLNDNADTAEAARKELSEMVRQVPDKPLTWLKSFTPMIASLAHALGEATLNDVDTKKWKLHFVKQLNMKEREKISAHKEAYLQTSDTTATDTAAVNSIKDYLHGNFNTKNLKTVLQGLNDSLPPFTPDTTVKDYMSHYSRNKKWKHKVDFNAKMNAGLRNKDKPEKKHKSADTKFDSKSKKGSRDKNKDRGKSRRNDNKFTSSSAIPQHLQCKRPHCLEKGISATHKHDDCYYKRKHQEPPKRFPNLGQAPAQKSRVKAGMRTASRKPERVACWSCNKVGCDKHQCYICGKNHPKRDCPDKPKVYERLGHSKTFNSLMNEVFEPHLRSCAEKIVHTWGDQVCPKCHGTKCKVSKCRNKDKLHRQNMKETKLLYSDNTKLMEILEKAHHDPFHSEQMPTMNSAFLAGTVGQDDSDDESDQDSDVHNSETEAWSFNMSENAQADNNSSSDDESNNAKRQSSSDTDDSQIESSFGYHQGDSKHKRRKRDTTSSQSSNDSGSESEKDASQDPYSEYGSASDSE
jgi:hypothetical protein